LARPRQLRGGRAGADQNAGTGRRGGHPQHRHPAHRGWFRRAVVAQGEGHRRARLRRLARALGSLRGICAARVRGCGRTRTKYASGLRPARYFRSGNSLVAPLPLSWNVATKSAFDSKMRRKYATPNGTFLLRKLSSFIVRSLNLTTNLYCLDSRARIWVSAPRVVALPISSSLLTKICPILSRHVSPTRGP
jgi:hypothetical protein